LVALAFFPAPTVPKPPYHHEVLKHLKPNRLVFQDLISPLLPAIKDMWNLPCCISIGQAREESSFEAMQLSTQGSERQRKNASCLQNTWLFVVPARSHVAFRVRHLIANEALQMSLRFEKLMAEHRFNETAADLTDSDLLAQLVDRYNNFRSNVAIKKWQISDDMRRSIEGIILGMTPLSRSLIRAHLDHNKWEESGTLLALWK